jgi:hypothetical protein
MSLWFQKVLRKDDDAPLEGKKEGGQATKDDLDSFISESMSLLDLQQREAALEEVHGIPQNNCEDLLQIDRCLLDIERHLENIKQGTAYEVAEATDRSYVTDRNFRIMFLRAARYDPEAAAKRIVETLDIKRSIFGPAKLAKKVTLEDLEEEDIEYLESGAVQILPSKDTSGRKIVLTLSNLRNIECPESELRARFYLFMCLAESEETQIDGITYIYYEIDTPYKPDSSSTLLWNQPIHYGSVHGCFDSGNLFAQHSNLVLNTPISVRPRCRVHYGSYLKVREVLTTFGIPKYLLPTSGTEIPTMNHHKEWVLHRKKIESERLQPNLCNKKIKYTDNDVLLGYRKNHNGNLKMRKIILTLTGIYDLSSKTEKAEITDFVIEFIKRSGGRFLRQNDYDEWREVSFSQTRDKVTTTFRNIKRLKKKKVLEQT